jgi:homoserine kinase
MSKVSVTVPASTANLGPGFDCLAIALGLHNTIEVEIIGAGVEILIEGEGANQLPKDDNNLCLQAFKKYFDASETPLPGMIVRMHNRIPLSSGLGSSSATIIGGLLAADTLLGGKRNPPQILNLASDFEDHLDNTSASLLGGFIAVTRVGGEILTQQIPIPDLSLIIILPEITLSTVKMREALPSHIAHQDAVHNLSHLVFTMEALRQGNFETLGKVMKDKLHHPYRIPLIPGYPEAERAALDAGAAAVALSGAGPAMVAFANENHGTIAQAMREAFNVIGLEARQFVLPVDHTGARVSLS